MFANISYQEKEAFFSLLDEYFASRPQHLPSPAGSARGSVASPPPHSSSPLGGMQLSSIGRYLSSGPSSPAETPGTPGTPMTEKELQKEAKDRQKEQERMELALRIGKAGIRSSMATTKGALGLVTRSDKAMATLDKHGVGGLVRGASTATNHADSLLRTKKTQKPNGEEVTETTMVTSGNGPPPPPEKKKGMGSLGKMFGGKDPKPGPPSPEAIAPVNSRALPPPVRSAPVAAAPVPDSQAQVVYSYEGADSGDLSVQTGQVVNVLEKTSDDWWTCEDGNGQTGLVPSNYLKEL